MSLKIIIFIYLDCGKSLFIANDNSQISSGMGASSKASIKTVNF